jgi:phosphatidate cytidylyltransferase
LDSAVVPTDRSTVASRGLALRAATAVLGIPLTILLVVLGKSWLLLGVCAVIVAGLLEFYAMAERIGYRPVWEAGVGAGLLFAGAAAQAGMRDAWGDLVLPALLLYTVIRQLWSGVPNRGLTSVGVTLLGALYVGYLFSFLVRLRSLSVGALHDSPFPALLVISVVWAADSAAYFVGLGAGRHKLMPRISPNKSVEGAVAGILAGIAAGVVFARIVGMSLPMAGTLGAVCALASVCGDLWESAIKREAGVKDAGWILPGHGGVLDRFDGLLFAAATGYAVMRWWPGG